MKKAKQTANKLEKIIDKLVNLKEFLDELDDDDMDEELLDDIDMAIENLESAKDICEEA